MEAVFYEGEGTGAGEPWAHRERREQTRARILETTLELIADHGFAATSTREISERLGLTKAALYYHFRTKEELLAAIVAPAMSELAAIVAHAEAELPLSPAAKRGLLARYVDLVAAHADLVGVLANDPGIRRSTVMQEAPLLYERLVRALTGTEAPDETQRARGWAAFGAVHAGLFHAELGDNPGAVRDAVLAAACGALGMPTGRRASSGSGQ